MKRLGLFFLMILWVTCGYAYEYDVEQYTPRPNNPIKHHTAKKVSKEQGVRDYSYPKQISTNGSKVIMVKPSGNTFAAYDVSGNLVRTGEASAGKHWDGQLRRATTSPVGQFTVFKKQGPNYKSHKYPLPDGGAPMPYAMFFKPGFAIHSSDSVPPWPASHGCIRVKYQDAEWLNKDFVDVGTTVIIEDY